MTTISFSFTPIVQGSCHPHPTPHTSKSAPSKKDSNMVCNLCTYDNVGTSKIDHVLALTGDVEGGTSQFPLFLTTATATTTLSQQSQHAKELARERPHHRLAQLRSPGCPRRAHSARIVTLQRRMTCLTASRQLHQLALPLLLPSIHLTKRLPKSTKLSVQLGP